MIGFSLHDDVSLSFQKLHTLHCRQHLLICDFTCLSTMTQQAQTNKQTNKTKSKHQNKLIYNHHSASYFSSFNNRPITYQRRVITKLPNSEQSYKGKVKTHKYIRPCAFLLIFF
jgi:hypothetical protein